MEKQGILMCRQMPLIIQNVAPIVKPQSHRVLAFHARGDHIKQ